MATAAAPGEPPLAEELPQVDAAFLSPGDFRPTTEVLAPSGAKARTRANIEAITLLKRLDAAARPATPPEQRVLAAWSGWGAVPEVFDRRNDGFAPEREQLRELLTREQYEHAEASVLNAHYTDPAIAATIWKALQQAGFDGGRVLEPGCGSGTFIGHAPDSAVMVGVENDDVTAAVAAALYPSAQVRHEGFETTRVPENSSVATVGNVPFGRFAVHDPAHNPQRHSIHNHFILKSLALTAPGGYVAVLTSRYTMDSVDDGARRDIADRADLVGAVRLPSRAFSRVAGTDVVTDLLIFRRRNEPLAAGERPLWIDTGTMVVDDDDSAAPLPINAVFLEHPENILGTVELGRGINGSPQLVVRGETGQQLADRLDARLSDLIAAAVARGAGLTATAADVTDVAPERFNAGLLTAADRGPDTPLYTLRYNDHTRGIEYWSGHAWEPNKTPKTAVAETRQLIALRDAFNSLVTSQVDGRPASERDQLRGHLNQIYDAYVAKYGPVNRFTWVIPKDITQDKHDDRIAEYELKWRAKEGEPGQPYRGPVPDKLLDEWETKAWKAPEPYKKRSHLDGGMRQDPGWAVVSALEIFEEATGQARKSPIFSTDVLSASRERSSAASPEEALAMSMDRLRRVDLDLIGSLLDVDADTARDMLDGLVYPSIDDPDHLVPAVTALSGNVRDKLAAAERAAHTDPVFNDYVRALREVVPADRTAEQIRVRPGAPWIAADVVAQFACETFGLRSITVEHLGGRWTVEAPNYQRNGRLMTEAWGMERKGCDAVSLLDALCNSRSVTVTDDEGVLDVQATFAAQAKATKISEEFGRWVFADETRREILVAEYNRRFNSLRAPKYDGTHLQLPGLSDHFTPHWYQRNAVARIISEPTVLLDHVVGAGKSGSMIMGAYELKRLGLVRQPWIVCPNTIVEQLGREAKQWYPAANVLVGSSATTAEGRRRFIAQTAASDWDMVIVPESAFTAIGVSDAIRADYIAEQLASLREQLERADADRTKKAIERALKSGKERLERLTSQVRKDVGLSFSESGCDYLFVDEAHYFKNLQRVGNIEELNCTNGSQRAEDLALKLRVLRDRRHDEARAAGIPEHRIVERVATFSTGTPIANSLGELWVMQTYLRPDLLEAAGVAELGDWGAAFTATHTTVEVNATGTKLRPVTKVGKFTNLPALLALSSVYSDVVTRDQVPVRLPVLVGGQREIVTIKPDIEVVDFIADLGFRADHLDARNPRRDNILKIANDGRNVSLDPRLAGLGAPTNSRAAAVAEQMMRIRGKYADHVYTHPDTGETMAKPGCFQIAFCDRGTPKEGGQFTIYAAIKEELITRGVPAEEIRFVHEARRPSDITVLRQQCINGDVSVLIGSTEKMGTGWNVQPRLAGEHHVDVPWRPADLEQREGRIIRQGNQNDEIEILGYVVESSYDTVMWQKVEAKTLFIEQVRRNEVNDLEIEDLSGGDLGAAAAEAKALATGDPRYLRQVQLDEDVRRLQALERAHHEATRRRDWLVSTHERTIPVKERNLAELAPVAERAAAAETAPPIVVDGSSFADRSVASARVAAACRRAWDANRDLGSSRYTALGVSVDGVEVMAARDLLHDMLLLKLAVPSRISEIKKDDLLATVADPSGAKARGLVTRLENMYADLPRHHAMLLGELDRDHAELSDLLGHPPGPFEQVGELTDRQAELAALTLELRLASQSPEALAAAAAAEERMKERGREPGWTLLHNPTPYMVEESGFLDADSMREAVRHSERSAALEWAQKRSTATVVDVVRLAAEVDYLDSAGGVSGAGMYPPPPDRYASVPEPDRQAVAAIAAGAQSVQVLTVGADADKAAALTAIAAAARTHDHRILALPATDTAKAFFDEHPYADRANTPQIAHDKFTGGQWTPPPGTLIVVDDAEHLTAEQLHCFTTNAVATNTKLLLVTTGDPAREPTQTLVDTLATHLPWTQHIGTPTDRTPRTAIEQARRQGAGNPELADPTNQQQAADLLARADTLTRTYTQRLSHRPTHRTTERHHDRDRDTGLER